MTNAPTKSPPSFLDRLVLMLASTFFCSYLPAKLIMSLKAPTFNQLKEERWTGAGLVGSLWGLATFLLLPAALAQSIPLIIIGVIISVAISHRAEQLFAEHDDSRIVIDEWIGAWIAVWGLRQHISIALLIAFGLFRLIDVFKGPLIRRMQNWRGGIGVTMDDVAAGVIANMITRVLISYSPLHLH